MVNSTHTVKSPPSFFKGRNLLIGKVRIFKRSYSNEIAVLPYKPKLKQLSRGLHKEMTDAERRLWSRIRGKQILAIQFYRQKPIGNYIVDFYAPAVMLVIEIDGSQHFDTENMENDNRRTKFLKEFGLTVLRFNNTQVFKQLEDVVEEIYRAVNLNSSSITIEKKEEII